MKLAINGLGRIGRLALRQLAPLPDLDLVAVNDLAPARILAHLMAHDSIHGKAPFPVASEGETLLLGHRRIPVLQESDPAKLPFGQMGADLVLECTGRFTDRKALSSHLQGTVRWVVVSAPMEDADAWILPGFDDLQLQSGAPQGILSLGSATAQGLAPLVKVLDTHFGFEKGLFTAVQSYTHDQNLLDLPHRDLRRARAAGQSMIPTPITAAEELGLACPRYAGKLDGLAVRVPTPDVSLADLTALVSRGTTAEAVNRAFREAARGPLKGYVEVLEEELVSADLVGTTASCLVDPFLTQVTQGHMVKVFGWYDNEWAYSTRVRELIQRMV